MILAGIEYGYKADPVSKSVKPQMMNQRITPPELLNDLVCFCKDLSQEDCVCLHNEQPCTIACSCNGCTDVEKCCKNIFTLLASV